MSHRPADGAEGTRLRRRRRPRRWSKRRRTLFLDHLAESCNVSAAARKAGMDRSSAYDLKDRDPAFARGWGAALERAHGEIELWLMETALKGSVRTEMSVDPKTQEATSIKLVHSYPVTVAMRLYLSHRAEVAAFRVTDDADEEEDVGARVRAHMDLVRGRLIALGVVNDVDEDGGGDGG